MSILSTKYSFCQKLTSFLSKFSSTSASQEGIKKAEGKLTAHKKLVKSLKKKKRIKRRVTKKKERRNKKRGEEMRKVVLDSSRVAVENSSQRSQMGMMSSDRMINPISDNRLINNNDNFTNKIIKEMSESSLSDFDYIIHSKKNPK